MSARFTEWDDWTIAQYTHGYPEWVKNQPPKGGSKPISIDDLLEATGLLGRKAELLANEKAERAMKQILAWKILRGRESFSSSKRFASS